MIELLAQTGPAAPSPGPYQTNYGMAAAVLVGILLAGLIVLALSRGLVRRLRLMPAYMVGTVAVALYSAALVFTGRHTFNFDDPVVFWATRIFAAAMVFVLLRLIDRLALVPLLTRGGKTALPRFIHQIANIVLAVFAILIYGSIAFGWDIDKFLAGSAVVSIVLGLALQESLGNFFSGLVMQASPPFAVGHRITCGSYEGKVVDMTWRAVTLYLDDDNYVIIPNATVAKSEIVNHNVPSRATARFARVGLDYELPPADAIVVLTAAALESEGVLAKPAPEIYLEEFADSSMVYAVKYWIDDAGEYEIISHRVRMHIWYRLREKGYSIPFPIRTVEHSSHAQKARLVQQAARSRRMEAIAGVPLLSPLTDEQKRILADSANELYLTTGQVMFRQGDSGDSFYIIFKGSVDVLVTPEGAGATEQRKVAALGPGDFFGEMSALTGQPRSATIRATAPLACVQIEKQDLLEIFKMDPSIMAKVSEIVARRNVEREAVMKGAGTAPAPEMVVQQQKSLLGRMIRFFRLNAA